FRAGRGLSAAWPGPISDSPGRSCSSINPWRPAASMGGQGQRFLGAGHARLLAGLLPGLDDELRLEDLEHLVQRPEGEVRATREHATELSRIDSGGLTKLS